MNSGPTVGSQVSLSGRARLDPADQSAGPTGPTRLDSVGSWSFDSAVFGQPSSEGHQKQNLESPAWCKKVTRDIQRAGGRERPGSRHRQRTRDVFCDVFSRNRSAARNCSATPRPGWAGGRRWEALLRPLDGNLGRVEMDWIVVGVQWCVHVAAEVAQGLGQCPHICFGTTKRLRERESARRCIVTVDLWRSVVVGSCG